MDIINHFPSKIIRKKSTTFINDRVVLLKSQLGLGNIDRNRRKKYLDYKKKLYHR